VPSLSFMMDRPVGYVGERELFNRREWLETQGFRYDPFLPESFHAETDSLLVNNFLAESYVDMKDASLLIGDFYIPGSRFIFAKSGGGKSSIRKRIHIESNKVDLLGSKPVLVVDYIDHGYPVKETSIWHHTNRIVSLVEAALNNSKIHMDRKNLLDMRSPKSTFKKMVRQCDKLGYKGVYILIDNINIQSFEKILPLALNTELNRIKGLVVKIFIPEELFTLGQQTLPFQEFAPYILQWEESELEKILRQRLSLCLNPMLQLRTSLPGIASLCTVDISDTVQNQFINIGKFTGPGGMWEFGYHLLEEFIKLAESEADLINELAFDNARLRMFDTILNRNHFIDYGLIEDLQNKHKDILSSSSTYRGNKAKIFLCCIPGDHDIVYNILFKPLESENYKPLMMNLNTMPGEKYRKVANRLVGEADYFIPCFSNNSLKKPDMFHYALRLAKERQQNNPDDWIFIIPALLDKCTITDTEVEKLKPLDLGDEEFFSYLLKSLEKGIKLKKGKKL
jgi:hypothetical protein